LAEAAIDAFHHVDIEAVVRRVPSSRRSDLDGDCLSGADRLAKFAGNATFLPVWIASHRKFAAKARRERPLLEG
jgi:hypothetical protein